MYKFIHTFSHFLRRLHHCSLLHHPFQYVTCVLTLTLTLLLTIALTPLAAATTTGPAEDTRTSVDASPVVDSRAAAGSSTTVGSSSVIAQPTHVRATRVGAARVGAARVGAAPTVGPLKVALFGDQGVSSKAVKVLSLVQSEGADMILHLGDLGYDQGTPIEWDQQISDILGADFPLFAVIGNHEEDDWPIYQQLLTNRLNRIPEASCTGEIGIKAACRYKGLFFLQAAPGISESSVNGDDDYATFLREELANDDALWSFCTWHKNQQMMQVGGKVDATGWEVYEACREGGAIVATGHEHSYSRTHLMDGFEDLSVASGSGLGAQLANQASNNQASNNPASNNQAIETMVISEGESFAVVSGIGGYHIRPQLLGGDHWASIYTATQGANHGALFCTLFADGQANKAECYFKDIDGRVPDQFTLISTVDSATNPAPDLLGDANCDGLVDVVDSMIIVQYNVDLRRDNGSCPLSAPFTELNANMGDITGDGQTDVNDALAIMQCLVGLENRYCNSLEIQ